MAMIAGREYCMRSFPMGFVPNSIVALLFILFLFWGGGADTFWLYRLFPTLP